ncbi:MAG: hypothetical protein JXA06_04420, partial [Bacteroidetes bacterium]|nr:hypothetical protein [Bacteroidota bacterium]
MALLINTRLLYFIGLICFVIGNNSVSASELNLFSGVSDVSIYDSRKGYNDAVYFQEKYIAVGTDGRIDCITLSGEKIPLDTSCQNDLNCAYANDKILLIAGDQGKILFSSDGKKFFTAASGIKKDIHTIAYKGGVFIAGADSGTILNSMDGISWKNIQTKIRGNILSISTNNSFFIGVTESGEIIKSMDGMKWEIQDYNKEYAGYNPYSKFRKILAGP